MAIVKPFKAIRPAEDKRTLVPSHSYQEYSKKEREAILNHNPFSFLHIISPGFKLNQEVAGNARFKLVHKAYLAFLKKNILLKDAKECFYLYQLEKEDFTCCGIFCGTSASDYQNNIIKKHEDTIQTREELFANYLKVVGFYAEAVLMTYPDNESISTIFHNKKQEEPDCVFTTTDKAKHKIWVISDSATVKSIQDNFSNIKSIYIADGHHRSASSSLFAKTSKNNNIQHSGKESYNYFMSYLIPESEIKIYEFNRKIKTLNGLTKKKFLNKLNAFFKVESKGKTVYKPTNKHHFSMYLDGDFYSLYLKKEVYSFSNSLEKLDTQILYKTVLKPILGISNLKNNKRIQYGYGKNNIIKMKDEIDNGKYKVGFSLVPITINEIKAIANAGLIMPPKSTYIEPKLRSGLLIYEL